MGGRLSGSWLAAITPVPVVLHDLTVDVAGTCSVHVHRKTIHLGLQARRGQHVSGLYSHLLDRRSREPATVSDCQRDGVGTGGFICMGGCRTTFRWCPITEVP